MCFCSSPASLQFLLERIRDLQTWKDGSILVGWVVKWDAKMLTQQTNLECQDCFWWIFAEVPTKKSGNWLPKSIVHRPFRCCLATHVLPCTIERGDWRQYESFGISTSLHGAQHIFDAKLIKAEKNLLFGNQTQRHKPPFGDLHCLSLWLRQDLRAMPKTFVPKDHVETLRCLRRMICRYYPKVVAFANFMFNGSSSWTIQSSSLADSIWLECPRLFQTFPGG